jgi:hypothetical protein
MNLRITFVRWTNNYFNKCEAKKTLTRTKFRRKNRPYLLNIRHQILRSIHPSWSRVHRRHQHKNNSIQLTVIFAEIFHTRTLVLKLFLLPRSYIFLPFSFWWRSQQKLFIPCTHCAWNPSIHKPRKYWARTTNCTFNPLQFHHLYTPLSSFSSIFNHSASLGVRTKVLTVQAK